MSYPRGFHRVHYVAVTKYPRGHHVALFKGLNEWTELNAEANGSQRAKSKLAKSCNEWAESQWVVGCREYVYILYLLLLLAFHK